MTTVKDFYEFLDSFAPFSSQEEWDNSGLLAGDMKREVKKAAVVLDVTPAVFDECIKKGVDLIISHHPLIFREVKNVLSSSVLYKLIKNEISLISSHTCLDKAPEGVNFVLCERLGLNNISSSPENPFIKTGSAKGEDIEEFAKKVNKVLGGQTRFVRGEKKINKVAVCSGSGGDFVYELVNTDIDAFVTGEASYHQMLWAKEMGMAVISAGHFETEKIAMEYLSKKIIEKFPDIKIVSIDEKCETEYIG